MREARKVAILSAHKTCTKIYNFFTQENCIQGLIDYPHCVHRHSAVHTLVALPGTAAPIHLIHIIQLIGKDALRRTGLSLIIKKSPKKALKRKTI